LEIDYIVLQDAEGESADCVVSCYAGAVGHGDSYAIGGVGNGGYVGGEVQTGVVGGEEGVSLGFDEVVEAALVEDVVVFVAELVECIVVILDDSCKLMCLYYGM
jgi:hypothetical protein